VAAGLVASGCDSAPAGSKNSATLIPQMEAAARAAKTVRAAGSVDEGSQVVNNNMSFSRSWVVGTAGSNGASFFLLELNGKTYIKADAAFLKVAKAPASACAVMCGKYVELPALTYPHGHQHIAFTEWNSVTAPAAPPADQVLDVNNLG
jgi:hypothetical protein